MFTEKKGNLKLFSILLSFNFIYKKKSLRKFWFLPWRHEHKLLVGLLVMTELKDRTRRDIVALAYGAEQYTKWL
jgi:hypothetical protein